MAKGLDIYDLFVTDDMCYTDSELISEAERASEDLLSMVSTVKGFDLKWD